MGHQQSRGEWHDQSRGWRAEHHLDHCFGLESVYHWIGRCGFLELLRAGFNECPAAPDELDLCRYESIRQQRQFQFHDPYKSGDPQPLLRPPGALTCLLNPDFRALWTRRLTSSNVLRNHETSKGRFNEHEIRVSQKDGYRPATISAAWVE